MQTKRNISGLRISVPQIQRDDKFELGWMICQSLNELGNEAFITSPRSTAYLDSDLFLLIGSYHKCTEFQRVFRKHRGPRPVTLLWQWDPLPPPHLAGKAEKTGLMLGGMHWDRLGKRTSRFVRRFVPFSSKACRTLRKATAPQVKKHLIDQYKSPFEGLDSSELFSVMAPYAWLKKHLREGWIDYLAVTTLPKQHFLQSKGIASRHVPIGYHPTWGRDLTLPRDIDVLYLGRVNCDYRRNTLNSLQSRLAEHDMKLEVVTADCYGEQRTRLLNRTKIAIDIPRLPWDTGGMRFLISMSCGAMVVSCTSHDTTPYIPVVHLVQTTADNLAESVLHYLKHEDERRRITKNAYDLVTGDLTMKNMLSELLEICHAHPSFSTRSV